MGGRNWESKLIPADLLLLLIRYDVICSDCIRQNKLGKLKGYNVLDCKLSFIPIMGLRFVGGYSRCGGG